MSSAEAFQKNKVPTFWGAWASQYLSPTDIREAAALINDDVTKTVSTPRRFFLNKLLGDYQMKVLDLPENATPEQTASLENVGMFINHMMTREKMALPGWLDDISSGSGFAQLMWSFWMRPGA